MHIRGVGSTTKRLGHYARRFAHGAGSAMDKAAGVAHQYGKNVDPEFVGAVGGALGHDAAAITKSVVKTKKNLASYEDLRRSLVGSREG